MGDIMKVYHRTVPLGDSTFVARIEVLNALGSSVVHSFREDVLQFFKTQREAEAREFELAEDWKSEHALSQR